jgi:predicted Ser/Thr protein kinase
MGLIRSHKSSQLRIVQPLNVARSDFRPATGTAERSGRWCIKLWRTSIDGREALVKDVSSSSWLYRRTIGRRILRHESAIYARLGECSFAPRFLGWIDPDALAIEHVPSVHLGHWRPPSLTPEFYQRLEACIRQLHAQGIVHLDLRNRRNILVTADAQPMLVDFGNAMYLGRSWLSRRVLVPLLGGIDRLALLKFRHKDFPESLSASERIWYQFSRIGRWIWPFGRMWRALGINRAHKRRAVARAAVHSNAIHAHR